MPVIRKNEAMEKLAQAVVVAAPDYFVEIYLELFPEKKAPDVSGVMGKAVADQLAQHIRAGLEPEEIVDLWNVVFPADRHVSYDEEEGLVRYNEEKPWYAER